MLHDVNDERGRALLLESPDLALSARLAIIDAADTSLDLQYFIWQNDATGILTVDKVLTAADRGVRVRALLDDVQLEGLVSRLSAMDKHPNVEIRIFNPFSVRLRMRYSMFRLAEMAIDGNRLNHRMHNKLMVADNQLAILGGRNIGDDYFGYGARRNFIDTDLLLSGPIVPELSQGFDVYWNSPWAYPVRALLDLSIKRDNLEALRNRIQNRLAERTDLLSLSAGLDVSDLVEKLIDGPAFETAATFIDDPDVSWFDRPDEMSHALTEIALSAEREVLIASPYIIPTANMLKIADQLISRGVKITAVTNSLGSNDVVIAHAAYAKSRRNIVRAGVELYEMRGDPAFDEARSGLDVCMHSKYMIIDDDLVFVGSMNLDPRSLYLNTEVGVALRSKQLAAQLRDAFNVLIQPENSWRVVDGPNGVKWHSSAGVVDRQPAKNGWQRFRAQVLSLLPVTNQI